MLNLTKVQTIAEHRKMWNWITDETLRQERKVEKSEYFDAMGIVDIPLHRCFCCNYTACNYELHNCEDCKHCPIEWGGEYGTCLDRNCRFDGMGLFSQWFKTEDFKEAAKLARMIAELPERKDCKC